MNDNILDDNLESIDKPFVRTERIQQIETVVIVGCMVILALQIWNTISLLHYILEFGMTSFIILIGFAMNLWIFGAFIWWRKVSIEYDSNTNLQRIELPSLLKIARIWIPIYGGWVLLGSVGSIIFLFNYLSGEGGSGLDLSSYILRTFVNIIIAFLYIYYWRITKQSMDFINK